MIYALPTPPRLEKTLTQHNQCRAGKGSAHPLERLKGSQLPGSVPFSSPGGSHVMNKCLPRVRILSVEVERKAETGRELRARLKLSPQSWASHPSWPGTKAHVLDVTYHYSATGRIVSSVMACWDDNPGDDVCVCLCLWEKDSFFNPCLDGLARRVWIVAREAGDPEDRRLYLH